MKRRSLFKIISGAIAFFAFPIRKINAATKPVVESGPVTSVPVNSLPSTWRTTPKMSGCIELLDGPGGEIKDGDKIIHEWGEEGRIILFHHSLLDGPHPKNIRIIDRRHEKT